MSKERIEEIKGAWHDEGDITDKSFYWLIEQAERFEKMREEFAQDIDFKRKEVIDLTERVQELERIIDKADEHSIRNGKQIMKLTDEKAELEYQNKRYREALEFYGNLKNWRKTQSEIITHSPTKIIADTGEKARQALEGDNVD